MEELIEAGFIVYKEKVAINFANWIQRNCETYYTLPIGYWYYFSAPNADKVLMTTEELYKIYNK